MMLDTYTPKQCPNQVSTFYTLWFLIYRLKTIIVPAASPHAMLDPTGKNNTHTALKAVG